MYSMEFHIEASNGEDIPAFLRKIIGETRRDVGIIDFLEKGEVTIARIKAPTIYALQLLITKLNEERKNGHIAFIETGKIKEE